MFFSFLLCFSCSIFLISFHHRTAERFDPREHAWTKIESMTTKRAYHALVPLGGKLYVDLFSLLCSLYLWSHFSSCYSLLASWLFFRYALGGSDGSQIMPSVEIYDPRQGTWMIGEPMNYSRVYVAAAALKESIYVIGGAQSDNEVLDTVHNIIHFIVLLCIDSIIYVVLLIDTTLCYCRLNVTRKAQVGK